LAVWIYEVLQTSLFSPKMNVVTGALNVSFWITFGSATPPTGRHFRVELT